MNSEQEAIEARKEAREVYWAEYDRDGRQCPDCRRTWEEAGGFDVHHIDGDPLNNELLNLVALCQPCHKNRHRWWDKRVSVAKMRIEAAELGGELEA